jgi:hypothetical protein
MTYDNILAVIKTIMPLLTVAATAIVTGLVVPGLLDKWQFRSVRRCHRSLLAYFDKFCRSLGCGNLLPTTRETYFNTDADITELLEKDQYIDSSGNNQWAETNVWQVRTALNAARIKAGLGSGKFYLSRSFQNSKNGRLLAVLTVKENTAEIKAYLMGDWKSKSKSQLQYRLRRIKVKFFGYDRPDYSLMLV